MRDDLKGVKKETEKLKKKRRKKGVCSESKKEGEGQTRTESLCHVGFAFRDVYRSNHFLSREFLSLALPHKCRSEVVLHLSVSLSVCLSLCHISRWRYSCCVVSQQDYRTLTLGESVCIHTEMHQSHKHRPK